MQAPIAQLATGLVGSLFSGGRRAAPGEESAATKPKSTAATGAAVSLSQYRQILAEHDVRRITPREFSQLIGELQSTGELDPSEAHQLQAIRVQLDAEGAAPDEPLDLLAWTRQRLAQAERAAAAGPSATAGNQAEKLTALRQQTGWIDRLDRAHQSALEGPLDVTA